MWTAEDNALFLKYGPDARDRCFHAMIMDTGARPHELLRLKIKDAEFKFEGHRKYAEIVVNGKTGERSLVLIDSIPYMTQWITLHPQNSNPESVLFPSTRTGGMLQTWSMLKVYEHYKVFFGRLLNKDISSEDKQKFKTLLKKRWNTYCHRHSAITEKTGILRSDVKLRQYAGWTARSNMHRCSFRW